MSGMKFRLKCADCGVTFFTPDRQARYCPKCHKKHPARPAQRELRAPDRPERSFAPRPVDAARTAPKRSEAVRPARAAPQARKQPEQKPPKIAVLTPELRERVEQLYRERFAGREGVWQEMVNQLSDELWAQRKAVSHVLRELIYPRIEISPELRQQIIEMYQGFVQRGERPPDGRRRTISRALNVPLSQVKELIYRWSLEQYKLAATPQPSREQLFAIEKLYWAELAAQRHRLDELPELLAAKVEGVSAYQIARWLDMLHDEDRKFANVQAVPSETAERIVAAYREYLKQPQPPEESLHATLAAQVGGEISTRQVHKTLQEYRNAQRAAYPLH